LNKKIYTITRRKVFNEDPDLRRQVRKASVSVMSNIAEGFERNNSTGRLKIEECQGFPEVGAFGFVISLRKGLLDGHLLEEGDPNHLDSVHRIRTSVLKIEVHPNCYN
jgi:hypothetical protein